MGRPAVVRTYSGYKEDERPLSFSVDGYDQQVEEVVDRWYDPDGNYFRVRAADGRRYLLRHDLNDDSWDLIDGDGATVPQGE